MEQIGHSTRRKARHKMDGTNSQRVEEQFGKKVRKLFEDKASGDTPMSPGAALYEALAACHPVETITDSTGFELSAESIVSDQMLNVSEEPLSSLSCFDVSVRQEYQKALASSDAKSPAAALYMAIESAVGSEPSHLDSEEAELSCGPLDMDEPL